MGASQKYYKLEDALEAKISTLIEINSRSYKVKRRQHKYNKHNRYAKKTSWTTRIIQNLGTIQKFSTLESQQDCIPQKNIFLQVTKFKKQNARKIAKGRPELYNWVRNHKKDIA